MVYRSIKKILGSFLISLSFISTGYSQEVSINFLANASLRISDGEYILFTDFPYVSGAFGHMEYTYPFFVEQGNNVTTLITSRMADHFDPEAFMALGWKVIAPAEVVNDLEGRYNALNEARNAVVAELERNRELDQAVRPDTEITITLPDPVLKPDTVTVEEKITNGPMEITAIKTKSAQTEHYSYLLQWHDRKIYFAGDTGDTGHLASLQDVDLVFLSPWLFENARKANALPNTKIVIYQHRVGEIIPNCFDCIVPEKGEYISFD